MYSTVPTQLSLVYFYFSMIFPTGICCGFNSASALRDSTYSNLVKELSKDITEDQVRNVKTGMSKGLQVMLDQHSGLTTFGSITKDYNGFDVFVGEPAEFPVVTQRNIKLQPGQEHFVEISAQSVVALGKALHYFYIHISSSLLPKAR